jgi:hypothetical protein
MAARTERTLSDQKDETVDVSALLEQVKKLGHGQSVSLLEIRRALPSSLP